jgi:alkylated DNA repair dioxygenase AlkB
VPGCKVPARIPDGELLYRPHFIPRAEADKLLDELIALRDWKQPRLRLFGRMIDAPRLSAWYGDPGATFSYSGVVHEPRSWPGALARLRDRLLEELELSFNGVLANRYRDGRDSVDWHSDDEKSLGERPLIGSITLGAERRFLLRHRTRKELETLALPLEHGSLLVMKGDIQRCWRHSLPRAARCKAERLNLTFRKVLIP